MKLSVVYIDHSRTCKVEESNKLLQHDKEKSGCQQSHQNVGRNLAAQLLLRDSVSLHEHSLSIPAVLLPMFVDLFEHYHENNRMEVCHSWMESSTR